MEKGRQKLPRLPIEDALALSVDKYRRWLRGVLEDGRQATFDLQLSVDECGGTKLRERPPWKIID